MTLRVHLLIAGVVRVASFEGCALLFANTVVTARKSVFTVFEQVALVVVSAETTPGLFECVELMTPEWNARRLDTILM